MAANKTVSERHFEQYLEENGARFAYEPSIPGKRRRPDYHVRWAEHELIVEIKELYARRTHQPGAASFDPYGHIRKAIEKARPQFKEYREHCCVLLLHNAGDWEFRDRPYVMFGAMLGDAGIQTPYDPERDELLVEQTRSAFLDGGRMIAPKNRKPRNTTISAIAVLRYFTIPNPAFEPEFERRVAIRRAELGAEPSIVDRVGIRMRLYEKLPSTLGRALQLNVFENPLARIPLDSAVFGGNYDARHRFNARLGRIERVFAGRGLMAAEQPTEGGSDISSRIDLFSQAIVRQYAPERIILFGSYAYGCPEPGSDVDLLVIFPGDGSAADRSLEIRQRLSPDFPLDLLARSAAEVEQRLELADPFMREILDKGKTLYSRKGVA